MTLLYLVLLGIVVACALVGLAGLAVLILAQRGWFLAHLDDEEAD